MTSQTDQTGKEETIQASALIAALKRRGYEVVEQTVNVCVFRSRDPEGYCVTVPAAGETLSAKMVRKILKDEPVDADVVVSESLQRLNHDAPLVIDENEVLKILRSTPHEYVTRTPEQLMRISEILGSIEKESEQVTERVNVSGNMDEYLQ